MKLLSYGRKDKIFKVQVELCKERPQNKVVTKLAQKEEEAKRMWHRGLYSAVAFCFSCYRAKCWEKKITLNFKELKKLTDLETHAMFLDGRI